MENKIIERETKPIVMDNSKIVFDGKWEYGAMIGWVKCLGCNRNMPVKDARESGCIRCGKLIVF